MGDFGYIFGYTILFALGIGAIIGYPIGYYQRKHDEPPHIRALVDKCKKEYQYYN